MGDRPLNSTHILLFFLEKTKNLFVAGIKNRAGQFQYRWNLNTEDRIWKNPLLRNPIIYVGSVQNSVRIRQIYRIWICRYRFGRILGMNMISRCRYVVVFE